MSEIRVCATGELVAGEARTAPLSPDHRGRPREAVVVRDEAGVPRAYVNRCRHLPIPMDAGSRDFFDDDRRRLICVTHGATYRLNDGVCDFGPCKGDALEPLELVESDGTLYVRDPSARPSQSAPAS